MQVPICPMQNVPPFESGPFEWVKRIIFGRSWWLYFSDLARRMTFLLRNPNFIDIVIQVPHDMTVGTYVINYPMPPRYRLDNWIFDGFIETPPTGTDIEFEVIRSVTPVSPQAVIAYGVVGTGANNCVFTTVSDENYTLPDGAIALRFTQIGSGTAGNNFRFLMRWIAVE